ncbi:hypothetical protein CVS47_00195 [Microbacterium lemovicicum]|uniref:DUF4352 domain-containing protein n=1 Tax=Microbacterium lemovicicum TaxID=1072463 RepID=A0A3S9W6M7_9MICO|nr:hypothetical protein CVS47_00195 [Microbacterium lemovicicum]
MPDDAYPELEPVPVDSIVDTQGLRVALTRFESVQGEVQGPGEVAGAAVRVTLSLTNEGDGDLDLDLVVLNAFMGNQRDPAETYEQPGGSPVTGTLAPGETAEGVYLFRIPEDRRGDVTFIVDYRQSESAVVFRGAIS